MSDRFTEKAGEVVSRFMKDGNQPRLVDELISQALRDQEAKIVAWLRDQARGTRLGDLVESVWFTAADSIERGEYDE